VKLACTQDGWGAAGINGRVKFLPLAWTGMTKTSYRKNSDSLESSLSVDSNNVVFLSITEL